MLSPEVQAQADEIRRNKSLVKSLQAERDLWKSKAMDSQEKLDQLSHKDEMSDEDREELKRQAAELDALNDELEGAAQDNVEAGADGGGQQASGGVVAATPLERNADAERADPLPGTGQNGTVPLMPNSAFDPDPTGNRGVNASQPNQPRAIETAGGFVIAGGGSVARAPGSDPTSPSSTLVVPTDPDAKAPANNADLVKSGLGDSSQNALLGNDGQPIGSGPGIPREPTEAEAKAAQEQADKVAAEMEARRANPLNLAEPGTPMAGSAPAPGSAAEADALQKRQQEQWDAQQEELKRNDAQQGKPAPGTPGPDPVAGPAPTPGPDGDLNQKAPA